MTSRQKVGWIGRLMGPGYGKGTLGLEPDRRGRLRNGLVVGEVRLGLFAVWPPWVFCSIGVPGERTHNCAMEHPSHRPLLENHSKGGGLARQRADQGQIVDHCGPLSALVGRIGWVVATGGDAGGANRTRMEPGPAGCWVPPFTTKMATPEDGLPQHP